MPGLGKILVVDDEQGFRDLYQCFLEPIGFDVDTACNGLEAVELARKNDYDLIFLDVHMPLMSGPEAFEQILAHRQDQKVLITSSSTDSSSDFETSALEQGAVGCLRKPSDLDAVMQVLIRELGCPKNPGIGFAYK